MWYIYCAITAAFMLAAFVLGYMLAWIRRPSFFQDIIDFHEKFELNYDGPARVLPDDLFDFRSKFMDEELDEYKREQAELVFAKQPGVYTKPGLRAAAIDRHLELQLDALVDLIYVVLGTAYMQFGPRLFPIAWKRVHAANMAKVRKARLIDGTAHTDSGRVATYDVVKPAGWAAPDHLDLIQERHHRSRPNREMGR